MRNLLITATLAFITAASQATPLKVVEVDAAAIHCLFETNCTPHLDDSRSPIILPGSTGAGFLQNRIIAGQQLGAAATGLYAYLYRIDLTGIQTNEPCFTNIVRCSTNRIEIFTTNMVCHTNVNGYSREVICEKVRIPETNNVFCFTNTIPPSTFIRCTTNVAGDMVCVTNFFPGTNLVFCHTIRLPEIENNLCRTNINPGSNVVTCAANRTSYYTNIIVCVTNRVPCFQTALPCIDTVRFRFGRVVSSFDYDGNGTNGDQVFLMTSSRSAVKPSSVEQSDGVVTLRFAPAICAGDSTVFIGFVSRNAPQAVNAAIGLSNGAKVELGTRAAADITKPAITCDFSPLIQTIGNLTSADFVQSDYATSLRESLLNTVTAASRAAQQGDLGGVLEGLQLVVKKVTSAGDEGGLGWLKPEATGRIKPLLLELLACLERFNQQSEAGE